MKEYEDVDRTTADERPVLEFYTPATPPVDRIEGILKLLFGRRGRLRADRQYEWTDR